MARARAREGQRGGARTVKGRGEARNIGMLGRIQVTTRWADDPVKRHRIRQWRGCWGRRGTTPPEGHQTEGIEDGEGL